MLLFLETTKLIDKTIKNIWLIFQTKNLYCAGQLNRLITWLFYLLIF